MYNHVIIIYVLKKEKGRVVTISVQPNTNMELVMIVLPTIPLPMLGYIELGLTHFLFYFPCLIFFKGF